ncbi:hypothetical protein F0562_025873 [Nyssa sinensis]|uniref:Myb-like domain-containing protein n=1 Tax=Nyssa sinensis TaxID=561372 RepID=A0A5J5BD91_9ASTE|nr:hypothetical protein F0562_025873 [Nyssa sinensis]
MEMGDQCGPPDLRQFMDRRTHFLAIPQPPEPFSVHRNLTTVAPQFYDTIILGGCHSGQVLPLGLADQFCSDFTSAVTPTSVSVATFGSEMEGGKIGEGGNSSRWPRQETLTLLEIRSRLDLKFKEANQKGPLWDEVSRIMGEEHGYQRSGKKCREKFENLYKYYKKTKEGKARRQDGKHYRFFRQLEALYGETNNQASVSETHLLKNSLIYQTTNDYAINQPNQEAWQDQKHCESLSFSNSSEFETSSSENNDGDLSAIAFTMKRSLEKKKRIDESQSFRRVRKSWKAKMNEFVGSNVRKLMETQEAWMEKVLKTIEHKEQEMMIREEEWRKQAAARLDEEYRLWATERAWVEARDKALMEALQEFTRKELKLLIPKELMAKRTQLNNKSMEDGVTEIPNNTNQSNGWPEPEVLSLIQLRSSMEARFQESGYQGEGLWEEIAAKMACLGYDWSVVRCKEMWENIGIYYNKKCKENSRNNCYFQLLDSYRGQEITEQRPAGTVGIQLNIDSLSPSNSNVGGSAVQGSCFNIWMNEGEHL